MSNRDRYEELNGGIMSNQFGAYFFCDLLPTKEREAPEPVPEDPATDLELSFGGLAPSSRAQYRSALKVLDAWSQGRPITDRNLALDLRHRDEKDRITLSTGRGIVQAAKFRAQALGQPSPVARLVKAGLKRLGREAAERGRGKAKGLKGQAIIGRMVTHTPQRDDLRKSLHLLPDRMLPGRRGWIQARARPASSLMA